MAKVTQAKSLTDEVRDALVKVIRDDKAPPTAKAIAGRSLLQLIHQEGDPGAKRPLVSMTIDELDAEIAAIQQEER
jgi:hypothetical protein